MTIDAARHRGTASDDLMTQINPDNVIAAHALLARQADEMQRILREAEWGRRVQPCGGDPVSIEAAASFQTKIDQIFEVHRAHLDEVREAAKRLREAVLQYGYTEDDIAASLTART